MKPDELRHKLEAARERWEEVTRSLMGRWSPGEMAPYHEARDRVLGLERELAAAKGEEYAEPVEIPVRWDGGAPLPHLIVNDYRALLCFYLRIEKSLREPERLGLVEFQGCLSAKLGAPNDEVFHGHPLHGRGLDAYGAQRVINSRWLSELEAINSVHERYNPAPWRDLTHYVFWFHDSTFECIARSFTVEVHEESLGAMLERMCRRIGPTG